VGCALVLGLRETTLEADVSDAGGSPRTDSGLVDAGTSDSPSSFTCPSDSKVHCETFDNPASLSLKPAMDRGALTPRMPGFGSAGALEFALLATSSQQEAIAQVSGFGKSVQVPSIDFEVFAESLPSEGRLSVGGMVIDDGLGFKIQSDWYITKDNSELFVAEGSESSSPLLGFTLPLGRWVHVHMDLNLDSGERVFQLDRDPTKRFSVVRSKAKFANAKGIFFAVGLRHFVNQASTGVSKIVIDNLVTNIPRP
jgi:hypothetical protein